MLQPKLPIAFSSPHPNPVFTRYYRGSAAFSSPCVAKHEYSVLSFYTGGSATLEQQGRWDLSSGDMMLIPAGAPHRSLAYDAVSFWGLGFSAPSLYAEGLGELLSPFERVRSGADARLHIQPERRTFLQSLFVELNSALQANSSAQIQKSLLVLILEEAKKASIQPNTSHKTGAATEALRYIERNCLRPISLIDVASAVGRSPSYLTTTLKKETGRSVQEWIIQGRLKEAQQLLRTNKSIEEIALQVGYSDARHLTRLFIREFKETPTQYRKKRLESGGSSQG
jgi:AraC family transcriptional activator of pobA